MHIQPATSVDPTAIQRCLDAVERRDPLAIPVDFSEADRRRGLVALDGDAVIGVGWLRAMGSAHRVEVRVMPGHRRRGIGGSIFARLAPPTDSMLASCDAAQLNVRRFLESRRFEPMGVIFVQRWDGDPGDVPRAFATAHIVDGSDRALAARLLEEASADTWPPPLFDREALADPAVRVRVACREDHPVGICAARKGPGGWSIGGLAVRPEDRGLGIGRRLLCELMSAAAADGDGVVLRVGHTDERVLRWTGQLGFWTCRSWVSYRRGPTLGDHHPSG